MQNVLTAAVALASFVWFHLTCCWFLDEFDALSVAGVLLITFVASVTEVIPRNLSTSLLAPSRLCAAPTCWDVVLAATDPNQPFWEARK